MGLLTSGTVKETKVIIEGKFVEMELEPHSVQVEIRKYEGGREMVYLRDSQGAFVEARCSQARDGRTELDKVGIIDGDLVSHEGVESNCLVKEDIAAELSVAHARQRHLENLNDELAAQVSALKVEV